MGYIEVIEKFLVSLKETIQNIGIITVVSIFLIIIFLIVLIIMEKRLKKKIVIKENTINPHIKKIMEIEKKNPDEVLKKIDRITKDFLNENFRVKKSLSYSELREIFKEKNNKKIADFCEEMGSLLYSGENTDSNTNQDLISRLTEIIKENPPIYPKKASSEETKK